ncbi:MAG: MAPEG family protein [Novosphingopyxis baekryungensis]|nr:MAPEG family protein [Novosphingopyxis baekryungensis]
MNDTAILIPAAALICWTLVMLYWMLLTRMPEIAKAGIDMGAQPGGRGSDLEGIVPAKTQWKAHNYNHLHEQPLLFYAVTVILSLTGGTSDLTWGLAWAYVVVRVVHSIWQSTINSVPVRFGLFLLGSIILTILAVMALIQAH